MVTARPIPLTDDAQHPQDVQHMRERLRPVLPGVGGGVRTHIRILPGRRITFGVVVVGLEGSGVVSPFVAEAGAKGLDRITSLHEHREVVVADLVAQMTEERAVALTEAVAQSEPAGIVVLADVDRDDPIGVPDGDRSVR